MEQLKKYFNKEWFIKFDSFKGKAGTRGLGVEANFSLNEKSVIRTLYYGKKTSLLVLDEAQHLKKVLDELHNVGFNKPLVFTIGGLGQTKNIFQELRVSRFDDEVVFDLEALDIASKKNIIRDFTYKDGGLDQTIECHLWVHKISEQT